MVEPQTPETTSKARDWGAGLALAAGVVLVYHLTFSTVPTSDGGTWVAAIDSGDYEKMLLGYHALPMWLVFLLKRLLQALGAPVKTLPLLQTVNAVVAALGVLLLFSTIRLLGGGRALALLGGALLAGSFGYWYFANAELHHFSLVVLLLIFLLLIRRRLAGRPCTAGFLVGLGFLNGLAVLLHQENFLFGFAVVAMLLVARPWRQGIREGLVFTVAGSLWTGILAVVVGVFLRGVSSPSEWFHWFFWLGDSLRQPWAYRLGNLPEIVVRVLKGQLTAVTFGTQVLADAAREPALLKYPRVEGLLGLTLLSYGSMAWLAAGLWRTRRWITEPCRLALAGCAVWLLAYKILLHSWFWPTAPEYHVVTLPPLILLLLLGPIAIPRRLTGAGVAFLLAAIVTVNVWGGILPWFQYGQMRDALAARVATTFRPDDFFISSESGIDAIFHERGRHLSLKGIFKRTPKPEGLSLIRSAIDEQLAGGRRVFLYNFVPGPFTLIGINQFARGEDRFSPRDFESFLSDLRARYVLRPVFSYWEESKAPLYLYGVQLETFWEVARRP